MRRYMLREEVEEIRECYHVLTQEHGFCHRESVVAISLSYELDEKIVELIIDDLKQKYERI